MIQNINLRNLFAVLLFLSGTAIAKAQNFYHQPHSSADILHEMKKAGVTGTVLYIAAHPDDENTRLISWLTNDLKVEVTYLSLTRGDGGQNLIGPEIGEGLGVIRTQELLRARQTDGGTQMFTRANDFGFSKTPEETLKIWDREKVLADVVWAIRKTRPDVIITRFSTEKRIGRSTHGHHTASAILASEAFDLAADPGAFPDQLKYVTTWQPKRLFWNTSWWFFGSEERFEEEVKKSPGKYLKLEVSTMIEELGLSCSEIASLSRSHHKSQGFGSTPSRGEEFEYLQLIKGEPATKGIFDGIDIGWGRLGMEDLYKKYLKIVTGFNVQAPHLSITELSNLVESVQKRQPDDAVMHKKVITRLETIIYECSRVYVEATYDKEMVAAGDSLTSTIRVINRVDGVQVKITGCSFRGTGNEVMSESLSQRGEWQAKRSVSLKGIPVSQPYWLNNQATVGMYHVDDARLTGAPESPYPLYFDITLKINGTEIIQQVPVVYSANDPVKGEVKYPVIIVPPVMVSLQENVYLFTDNKPREVVMEVIAGTEGAEGYAELNIPQDWLCEPKFHQVSLKTAGEKQLLTFKVSPSGGEYDGKLAGYFKTDDDVYGLGFHHIRYDHIPPQAVFPSCEARLVKMDIKTDPSIRKIGYIQGAGDMVPEALELLGFEVEQVQAKSVTSEALKNFDAIVVGIRAFNTDNDMVFISPLLNEFVKQGGVVVVQYNTAHRLVTEQIGPYEFKLSRNRVTEEDAKVELLNTSDPVLNWPNRIALSDFDRWVQERGLYFPEEWAPEYLTVIRIADSGEEASDGSILVAYYGEGKFVYTGISFFRQLPAGVPGAYKLMANLVSNPVKK